MTRRRTDDSQLKKNLRAIIEDTQFTVNTNRSLCEGLRNEDLIHTSLEIPTNLYEKLNKKAIIIEQEVNDIIIDLIKEFLGE